MDSKVEIFVQSVMEGTTKSISLDRNLTIHDLKLSLLRSNTSFFSFTCNGKLLSPLSSISDFTPLSTFILRPRLIGGGGDGGSTCAESRDCYLNMYAIKKPDKVDPNEQRLSKWMNCSLSHEPLKPPCVVDRLGHLFNKEPLVQSLLAKNLPKAFSHIKGLKDMLTIHLTPLPGFENGAAPGDSAGARFQCPISGLQFNGKYKFFALRTCGHVFSSKALKEVKSSSCLVCHKDYFESDQIVINGNEEEVLALREKMEEEKLKLKDKRSKKVKNDGELLEDAVCLDSSRLSGKKHGLNVVKVNGKVISKVEESGLAVKSAASNGVSKRFKAADMAPANATKEVYASIFTSSRKSNLKETYSCSLCPVVLTLWGNFVANEASDLAAIIEQKIILTALRVRVSSYTGLSITSRSSSSFHIQPPTDAVIAMRAWLHDNMNSVNALAISTDLVPNANSFGEALTNKTTTLASVKISSQLVSIISNK